METDRWRTGGGPGVDGRVIRPVVRCCHSGRHEINGQIFGIGLAITAYLLGVRHAFDADHIAAIDNTTRKLVADGQRRSPLGCSSLSGTPPWCS